MSEYWFAPPGREVVRSFYFQDNERLPQYQSEAVLRQRMTELPSVTTLFGWSAQTIAQDDGGVRVDIAKVNGNERRVLEADYVVGCDGSRSTVRESLGIDRGGADFDTKMVLAVFRSKALHEGLKRFPAATTYRVLRPELKGYWQFFGRVDVGEGWFFHAPVPPGTTTENYDFHGLLQQAAGFEFPVEFDHVGFWDLRIAVADKYRYGRIFIAGDAAHSHPPYGGFGLNSGLEDVANLGWKLAGALNGWGSDALLDSYGEERRPIFVETGEAMIAGGIESDRKFLDRYNPEHDRAEFEQAWKELEQASGSRQQAYEPHYEGSSVVVGPPGTVCSIHGKHSYAAIPGHHLTPQELSSGHNVFEDLGQNFTLLAFDADEVDVAGAEQAARSLNVPLKVIRDSQTNGRLGYESKLILVRPDQYVVWTGDKLDRDDASAVFERVTGQ
jgi:2-polyprenyl-6-methoxyphenol hydroxylase-like FAD-dependent oxidoreductase